MLTMFLKMKPPSFVGSSPEDVFEFIFDYYERMHKIGFSKYHSVNFVTYKLEGNVN